MGPGPADQSGFSQYLYLNGKTQSRLRQLHLLHRLLLWLPLHLRPRDPGLDNCPRRWPLLLWLQLRESRQLRELNRSS